MASSPRQQRACGLEALAFIHCGSDLRRRRTRHVDIENWSPLRIDGGVGPVRYRVGAHAPGELKPGVHRPLYQGLGTDVGQIALPEGGGGERPAGSREQVLTGSLSRIEPRSADAELLRAGLGERSAVA